MWVWNANITNDNEKKVWTSLRVAGQYYPLNADVFVNCQEDQGYGKIVKIFKEDWAMVTI